MTDEKKHKSLESSCDFFRLDVCESDKFVYALETLSEQYKAVNNLKGQKFFDDEQRDCVLDAITIAKTYIAIPRVQELIQGVQKRYGLQN